VLPYDECRNKPEQFYTLLPLPPLKKGGSVICYDNQGKSSTNIVLQLAQDNRSGDLFREKSILVLATYIGCSTALLGSVRYVDKRAADRYHTTIGPRSDACKDS